MTEVTGAPRRVGAGLVRALRADPLEEMSRLVREHGDLVRFRAAGRHIVLAAHPDAVQQVLQSRHTRYSKRTPPIHRLRSVLGEGLVTSEGDHWRSQRRTIQPAFKFSEIRALTPTIEEIVEAELAPWHRRDVAEPRDIAGEMRRLAFRVVGITLLGADLADLVDDARGALELLQDQANSRLYRVTAPPSWIPTRPNRGFRRALVELGHVVDRVIDRLHAQPEHERTAFSSLIESMPAAQFRDELVTLLLAGHENTGNALAWMLDLVSRNPEVERSARSEVDGSLDGRPLTSGLLAELPYTRQVVLEALRIYPPSWLLLRRAEHPDRIGEHEVARGTLVMVSPYLTHRHEQFWPDPEAFDPGRFTAERMPEHRCAFIPFGAGPRKCIGDQFALIEMQVVLCSVLRHFRLRPEGPPPRPRAAVSLLPDGGLWMTPVLRARAAHERVRGSGAS